MALEENTSPSSATGATTVSPKPSLLGGGLHRLRRAAAALAEEEIVADDDVARAQALDQHARDEIVGGEAGELGVEGEHDRQIEAEALEDLELLL